MPDLREIPTHRRRGRRDSSGILPSTPLAAHFSLSLLPIDPRLGCKAAHFLGWPIWHILPNMALPVTSIIEPTCCSAPLPWRYFHMAHTSALCPCDHTYLLYHVSYRSVRTTAHSTKVLEMKSHPLCILTSAPVMIPPTDCFHQIHPSDWHTLPSPCPRHPSTLLHPPEIFDSLHPSLFSILHLLSPPSIHP